MSMISNILRRELRMLVRARLRSMNIGLPSNSSRTQMCALWLNSWSILAVRVLHDCQSITVRERHCQDRDASEVIPATDFDGYDRRLVVAVDDLVPDPVLS